MDQWKPIESAPKDGKLFDVWMVLPSGFSTRKTDCFYGSTRDSECELIGVPGGDWKVTHWMPKPPPPEKRS